MAIDLGLQPAKRKKTDTIWYYNRRDPVAGLIPTHTQTSQKYKKNQSVLKLAGGEYYHFALKECLLAKLSSHDVNAESLSQVHLDINIDGLPIFKSSSGQAWPILGLIKSLTLPVKDPFVIGIYYGNSKPCNVNEYLSFLIQDVHVCLLKETGVTYYTGIYITLDIYQLSYVMHQQGFYQAN